MVPFILGKPDKTIEDVLKFQKSKLKLKAEPKFIYTYIPKSDSSGVDYYIYIATSGNGAVRISPDDFGWDGKKFRAVNNMYMAKYSLFKEAKYLIIGRRAYILDHGYYTDRRVKFSNYIAGYYSSYMSYDSPTIFYDTENHRFLQGLGVSLLPDFNGPLLGPSIAIKNAITTIPYTQKDKKFDYDNTGKDLVYMTSNGYQDKGNGSVFAILKDPDKADYYLAIFSLKDYNQIYYGKIDAIDLDKATHYAVSPQFGYLFYSVGGRVYQYDYTLPADSPNKNKIMLDKGAEEITLLKFQHFFNLNNKFGIVK